MNNKEHILIVDDDEGLRGSLRDIFEEKGYGTETAGTGREAIEKARGRFFNVGLLDIRLPDTAGVELLAPMKELHPEMALILVTGYASLETAVQALNEGASAYITKPLNMDEVLANVREALEKQRLIKEKQEAEEALRQRNYELGLLHRASQLLASTLDMDRVLITIVGEVHVLLNVLSCSVWLIDPKTRELVCRQAAGSRSDMVRGWRLAPGQGFVGWVARSGDSLMVPDTRTDERHFKGVEQQTGVELRSILSVPLLVKEEVIGVLQVLDKIPDRFRPAHLRVAEALAASAAVAVENARLFNAAQRELAERKRAEEALKEYSERLEEMVEEREDTFGDIAHQLYSPLTSIKVLTDRLADGEVKDPDTAQEYYRIIATATEQFTHMVTGILNLRRIEAEAFDLWKREVSLTDIVHKVVRLFRFSAAAKDIEIEMALGHNVKDVQVDEDKIVVALQTLLENAVSFSEKGTTVTISTFNDQEALYIQVKDEGYGIPADELPQIFDKHFRGRIAAEKAIDGVGIGLTIANHIVEQHGGSISLESNLNEGSTFTIELPLHSLDGR